MRTKKNITFILSELVFFIIFFQDISIAAADAVAYWQFQDNAPPAIASVLHSQFNTPATDGTAQSINGAPAPKFSGDVPGNVIWDGVTGSVVNMMNSASLYFDVSGPQAGGNVLVSGSLTQPTSFTFECFIRINVDEKYSGIAGKSLAIGINQVSWELDTGDDGRLRARIDNDGAPGGGQFNQSVMSDPGKGLISDNQWHHIAATYDAASRTFTLFVDYQQTGKKVIIGAILYDNSNFIIGKVPGSQTIGAVFDEARLSAQQLTPTQFLRASKLSANAVDFDRYFLANNNYLALIKNMGNLAGEYTQPDGKVIGPGIQGWFEYDIQVPWAGWYELIVQKDETIDPGKRYGFEHEYIIDGKIYLNGTGYSGRIAPDFKVSNVWLDTGRHTFRIQKYLWTGVHPLTHFEFRPVVTDTFSKNIRVALTGDEPFSGPFIRKGGSFSIDIFYAGASNVTMTVQIYSRRNGGLVSSLPVGLVASLTPSKSIVAIPGNAEGAYVVRFADATGKTISGYDLRDINFDVIDVTTSPNTVGNLNTTLIGEIDCAAQNPDYIGGHIDSTFGGQSRVITSSFGSYRESGDTGFQQYSTYELTSPYYVEPNWFAYILPVVQANQWYQIETVYPDDALRTFIISIREQDPMTYTLSSGEDTGGEFALTNRMKTHTMRFWPRTTQQPRLVILNGQQDRRAACSKIRVYSVTGDLPMPLLGAPSGGRSFGHYFEEPTNWASIFGAGNTDRTGYLESAIRWAQTIRYLGGDTMSVSADVYASTLYPSRNFDIAFSSFYQYDLYRMLLLVAEKYGLRVIADFHPRADNLDWPSDAPEPKPNKTISKTGQIPTWSDAANPVYSPVHPRNQDWYVGMLGEFSDRYADSSAFAGISLRAMPWSNKGLNNFFNLDWGYDDYTVGLFSQEKGIVDPGAGRTDSGRFSARYDYLVGSNQSVSPYRNTWIDWRTQKIADLYKRVRNRIQSIKPTLKLYSYVFNGFPDDIREAGFDVNKLSSMDGISLINAQHQYGRNSRGIVQYIGFTSNARALADQTIRDKLIDPAQLISLRGSSIESSYLFMGTYFEDRAQVVLATQLGLPDKAVETSAHIPPSGRSTLERFAVSLAEADANLLMNGGNSYFVDQPEMRDFLADYRQLPATRFTPRLDARDPVAVWELNNNGYQFYAVNREYYAVTIKLTFPHSQNLVRLSIGAVLKTSSNGVINLTLQPFELAAYRASSGYPISRVTSSVPSSKKTLVANRVTWLENLTAEAQNTSGNLGLSTMQLQTLSNYSTLARGNYNSGNLWRARTLTEHHDLLSIYQQLNRILPYPISCTGC